MLVLKVILQILAVGIAILGNSLDYRWNDRRTKKFKRGVMALYVSSVVLFGFSVLITLHDEKEADALRERLRGLQKAADDAARNSEKQREQQVRLEFLQHRPDEIEDVNFLVALDKPYDRDALGTFRVLLTVMGPATGTLYLSSYGPAWTPGLYIGGEPAPPGVQHTAWTANEHLKVEKVLQDTMIGGIPVDRIVAWSGTGGSFGTVQAFDNAALVINLTRTLWDKVAAIAVVVNDYVIFNQPRSCLTTAAPVHAGNPSSDVDWPSHRRPPGDTDWVNVVPEHYKPGGRIPPRLAFALRFSTYTPVLRSEMTGDRWRSLPIPRCDWYGEVKP